MADIKALSRSPNPIIVLLSLFSATKPLVYYIREHLLANNHTDDEAFIFTNILIMIAAVAYARFCLGTQIPSKFLLPTNINEN